MSPPRELRQVLGRALSPEARRAVWREAIGGQDDTARRELDKYLTGERGETLWKILEAAFKYVDRESMRAWSQHRFEPPDPACILQEIGEQLPLIFEQVERATELLEEQRKVRSLEDFRRSRG